MGLVLPLCSHPFPTILLQPVLSSLHRDLWYGRIRAAPQPQHQHWQLTEHSQCTEQKCPRVSTGLSKYYIWADQHSFDPCKLPQGQKSQVATDCHPTLVPAARSFPGLSPTTQSTIFCNVLFCTELGRERENSGVSYSAPTQPSTCL